MQWDFTLKRHAIYVETAVSKRSNYYVLSPVQLQVFDVVVI